MGEYAKYKGEEIKIGTCEDMYYLRFDQRHDVEHVHGNVNPASDDAMSIRFRFPWPDEDHIEPGGAFENYNRSVAVYVPMPDGVDHSTVQFVAQAGYLISLPCPEGTPDARIHRNGFSGAVKLVRQKLLADGRLVPILMCGGCGAMWREEEPDKIRAIADAFLQEGNKRRNDSWLPETGEKVGHVWWHTIASRILMGAGMEVEALEVAVQ